MEIARWKPDPHFPGLVRDQRGGWVTFAGHEREVAALREEILRHLDSIEEAALEGFPKHELFAARSALSPQRKEQEDGK